MRRCLKMAYITHVHGDNWWFSNGYGNCLLWDKDHMEVSIKTIFLSFHWWICRHFSGQCLLSKKMTININQRPDLVPKCHSKPVFVGEFSRWGPLGKEIVFNKAVCGGFHRGVPPSSHPFLDGIFPFTKTIQLLGYPHDYGNPLSFIINHIVTHYHPPSTIH